MIISKHAARLFVIGSLSTLFLAACSAAPSNKDIETAFQQQMDQASSMANSFLGEDATNAAKTDITIKNSSCKKADGDRYTCAFSMITENDFTGKQSVETSAIFINRNGQWVMVQGY